VTGAEALYADLGHFGRKPIQMAWMWIVLPCLLLNYMGQGALLLAQPDTIKNPFFLLVPHILLVPLVILATLATIIASQAVITGAYSMTSQAIQLGLLPRLEIRHTSGVHEGQIYMPRINTLLMLGVLFLVLRFKGSDALASAYGIAVTGTMLTTSLLAVIVIWKDWRRSLAFATAIVMPFIAVESLFMVANLTKFFEGGYFPLLFSAFMVMIMAIWVKGSRILTIHTRRRTWPMDDLIQELGTARLEKIRGTAIFLTGDSQSAPVALIQNMRHNKCIHERNIIVTVVTARVPKLGEKQRMTVEEIAPSVIRVILHFGYMEIPDVPAALAQAPIPGLDLNRVSYFLGRRTLVPDPERGMPLWQDHIFIALARAAANATDFYRLPYGKVVELGVRIAV
jgi:KUP system potassium uptake protein